jgi:hypothetical protein
MASRVCADHKNLACELAPAVAAWSSVSASLALEQPSSRNIKYIFALLQRAGAIIPIAIISREKHFSQSQRSHIIDWARVAQR